MFQAVDLTFLSWPLIIGAGAAIVADLLGHPPGLAFLAWPLIIGAMAAIVAELLGYHPGPRYTQ